MATSKELPRRSAIQLLKKRFIRGEEPAPSLLNHYRGHRGVINSVCFHPHLETVYSAAGDNHIMSWNFKKETRALRYEGHKGPVNEVTLSKDGDLMASCSDDQTVRIWVPIVKGEVLSIRAHSGAIRSVQFNPSNPSQFVTCSNDKSIKLWSVSHFRTKANQTKFKNHDFLSSFASHKNWVKTVRFSPDGRLLCSASDDKTVKIFDLRSNTNTHTLPCSVGTPTKADFNPCGGSYIGVSSTANSFLLYDVRMEKLIQSYTNISEGPINSFAFHPDGDFAVTVSEDAKIKILDLVEGRPIFTLYGPRTGVLTTAFNSDGKLFATGGKDMELLVWQPVLVPYTDQDVENFKENALQSLLSGVEIKRRLTADGTSSQGSSKSTPKSGSSSGASSRHKIHST